MKSTLIELPPEMGGIKEESVELSETPSVEEMQDEKRRNRLLRPGQSFGPYKILGFIAAGGMGEVYVAERLMEDGRLLGPVALKVIAPEYLDDWAISTRFKREAQISRAIRSPHVTRVYEFGETDDGYSFLAMEFLQGEELFDRLYGGDGFEISETVNIILELLVGLKAVHESGFIHRDIKPENIYFSKQAEFGNEVVKLLDFGIAKRTDQKSDPFLSVVGKIYGTPEYISPEQGLNPDVDERADLYSVGVILFECLTNHLPFEADSAYAIILAHQNEPVPRLPAFVDEYLAAIVYRSMEKKAENRYQSAAEMIADLQAWQDRQSGVYVPETGERARLDTPSPPQAAQFKVSQDAVSGGLVGFDEMDESEVTSAPQVQIFSRPKRKPVQQKRRKSSFTHDDDSEPSAPPVRSEFNSTSLAPGEPHTAERDRLRQDEAEVSKVARMVTAFVLLIIVAAVVFAVMGR